MIVIIVFISVLSFIFYRSGVGVSFSERYKRTEDGVTYRDLFGNLRLVRDGQRVMYKKNSSGRIAMFYTNGRAVNPIKNEKDKAIFKGEEDYFYDTWGVDNSGYVFEVIKTGEKFLKVDLNGYYYYLEYGKKPLRIVREVKKHYDNSEGVDIDEFNKISEEIYNWNPTNYGCCDYSDFVLSKYNERQRCKNANIHRGR